MKNGKGMFAMPLQMTPWQREDYMVNFNAADLAECQCPRCADFTGNMPELVRNLVDQRELAAYVLANPDDAGARMGLTDAVAEEIAIRAEAVKGK